MHDILQYSVHFFIYTLTVQLYEVLLGCPNLRPCFDLYWSQYPLWAASTVTFRQKSGRSQLLGFCPVRQGEYVGLLINKWLFLRDTDVILGQKPKLFTKSFQGHLFEDLFSKLRQQFNFLNKETPTVQFLRKNPIFWIIFPCVVDFPFFLRLFFFFLDFTSLVLLFFNFPLKNAVWMKDISPIFTDISLYQGQNFRLYIQWHCSVILL